jgi:hypothetical protein
LIVRNAVPIQSFQEVNLFVLNSNGVLHMLGFPRFNLLGYESIEIVGGPDSFAEFLADFRFKLLNIIVVPELVAVFQIIFDDIEFGDNPFRLGVIIAPLSIIFACRRSWSNIDWYL